MVNTPRSELVLDQKNQEISGTGEPVEWRILPGMSDYSETLGAMEERVKGIAEGSAAETVWLLEHPPLYTAGTSAEDADLLSATRFPVHRTGRGGEFTYHGPGQRVAYVMLDLSRRGGDVRRYVADLEEWIIRTLAAFNVVGERREDRVGVWVVQPDRGTEDKIAAIGIRVRRSVAFHGIALNIDPDLEHYSGIVPCGISGHGVTSLVDLGIPVTIPEVDTVMRETFEEVFGRGTTRTG
ncbi:MAG: lipoyl(octanoyl) transferase LipB [Rhodobiaceae bacterium]|nr:lipoyl(octanoyl) transferase LipB [Rhodobiaceae bacterium]MCC0061485.1 lipoyl(octanoyl) transferase LipB [Rhodobiaceae bacterium]